MKLSEFVLAQRTCRGNHNTFTRVYTKRIDIFHAHHGKTPICPVTDHFKFDFFPTFQRFFHKNLRGEGKRTLSQCPQLAFCLTNTATKSSQSVSRAYHDGITDLLGRGDGIAHRFDGLTDGRLEIHLAQFAYEEVAILCIHDGFYRGTQHLDTVTFQRALVVEFDSTIESRLSAEGQQDTIWTFLSNDLLDKIGRYRKEIYAVGHAFRGLNGGDVRIDQHGFDSILSESLQCLRAGVVELAGLPNLQRAGAKHKDFVDIVL